MEECLSSNGGHVKCFYGLTFDPSNGVENNADKLASGRGGVIKQRGDGETAGVEETPGAVCVSVHIYSR